MSFRRTSPRPQPRAPHPSSICFRQTQNGEQFTPSDAGPSSLLSCSYKRLFTPSPFSEGRSCLFSYSYKRLPPQLLSFDTHTNAPGVYRATRASSSTLCSLFALFAKSEKYLLSFQWLPHSLRKTTGVYPYNIFTSRPFPEGPLWEPSH